MSLEEEGIKMNKILILCLGILIITLPCSTSETNLTSTTTKPPTGPTVANAAGLSPWPTALCLLIPLAILAFIHSRS